MRFEDVTAAGVAYALAMVLTCSAAVAGTGEVVLRLKDSDIEISGVLKSFDGKKYVVEAGAFGVLSIDAGDYLCQGDSCKRAETASIASEGATLAFATEGAEATQRFAIHGADAIGRELMPALIREFARSEGGAARQMVGSDPSEMRFAISDGHGRLTALVDVVRSSSDAAIAAVGKGDAAIAMSSRPVTEAEIALLTKGAAPALTGSAESVVALDGLSVVVAAENPLRVLPIDKLARVFSGQITDWSVLGLPASPIRIYLGADSGGSAAAFRDLVLEPEKLSVARSATRLPSEADVADAVARDPAAIGITSSAFVRNARALSIGGTCGLTWQPDEFSIKSEEYPLSRRLFLYTAGTALPDGAARLLQFANADEAQGVIDESQFMNQTVVGSGYLDQRPRLSAWESKRDNDALEKGLAAELHREIADARRLSLTFRFALGSSRLDAKARQDLVRLNELLRSDAFKSKTVLLLGFTDGIGTPQNNLDLSWRRATQVRDAVLASLPAGAIEPTRLVASGFGAVTPVACNDGAEAMNRNRRVEVWVRDRPAKPTVAAAPTQPQAKRKSRER